VFSSPKDGYLRNRTGGPLQVRRGGEGARPGGHPHDLRRTFGSLARAAGADLR